MCAFAALATPLPAAAQYDALIGNMLGTLAQAGRAASQPYPAYAPPPRRPMPRQTFALPPNAQPSFDCARATTPSEFAICRDPGLAQIDRQMADRYIADLHAGVNQRWLTSTRDSWKLERDRCGSDPDCLRASYLGRIRQLSAAPSPSTSSVSAQVDDDAPSSAAEPDPASVKPPQPRVLEQMLMRLRPDLYASDLDALTYEGRHLAVSSPECRQLGEDVEDEVAIDAAVQHAREVMNRDLDLARTQPIPKVVRLYGPLSLDSYDAKRQTFSFAKQQADNSLVRDKATFVWNVDHSDAPSCSISPSPRALSHLRGTVAHRHDLKIEVSGGDRIRSLQVAPPLAKFLVRNLYSVPPLVSAVVDLTPADHSVGGHIRSAAIVSYKDPASGKITSVEDGLVLQRFPASLFSGSGEPAATTAAATERAIASTPNVLALNAVRLDPDVLPDERLMRHLPALIQNEQIAYREARTTNEKPSGAIFQAGDIEDHDPQFVASELMPRFRDYVRHAAAATGSVLRSGVALSSGGRIPYDFAAGVMRLKTFHPLLLDVSNFVGLDLRGDAGVGLKLNALKMRDDHYLYVPTPLFVGSEPRPPISSDAVNVLQEVPPVSIALDRLLLTPDLRLDKATAEAIYKSLDQNNNHTITSIVTYTVTGISSEKSNGIVLLGRLDEVVITGPDGEELARLDASHFPRAGEVQDAAATDPQAKATRDAAAAEELKAAQERSVAQHAAFKAREDQAKAAAAEMDARGAKRREIEAAEAKPDGVFGPMLAHVQIGMPLADAEKAVRAGMTVAAVVEPKAGSWGYSPSLLSQKTFVTDGGSDIVTLFSLPAGPPRVVAISRRTALPVPAIAQGDLVKVLTDKYGPPVEQSGKMLMWADGWDAAPRFCKQIMPTTNHSGFALTEGALPAMRSATSIPPADEYAKAGFLGLMTIEANDPAGAGTDLKDCPLTVAAMFDLNPTDPSLKTAVFDASWIASLITHAQDTAAPGKIEAVKALLDP